MTVHQIIITYDTSKYDNRRRNSIGRVDPADTSKYENLRRNSWMACIEMQAQRRIGTINAYEEENDDQKNQQEHKLEVNIF